jgi:hypothetical protein
MLTQLTLDHLIHRLTDGDRPAVVTRCVVTTLCHAACWAGIDHCGCWVGLVVAGCYVLPT